MHLSPPKATTKQAFSLVELSIVLVILGLLTGGILAGQSLIRASELRSVVSDYNRYRTASLAFRDKYFGLPGDITNATDFWGALSVVSNAACQALAANGTTATCNGNGDGKIWTNAIARDESFRYWQHLVNAGLIEGQYTGLYGGTVTINGNVPAGKLTNSYWRMHADGPYASTTTIFAAPYINYFVLYKTNGARTITGSQPYSPDEAWNIDTKIDDGIPGTGTVIAQKGNITNTNCTTVDNTAAPGDVNSAYALSNSSRDCQLYFQRLF